MHVHMHIHVHIHIHVYDIYTYYVYVYIYIYICLFIYRVTRRSVTRRDTKRSKRTSTRGSFPVGLISNWTRF